MPDELPSDVELGDVFAQGLAGDGPASEVEQTGATSGDLAEDRVDTAGSGDVLDMIIELDGATLQMLGVFLDNWSIRSSVNATPASWAMARMWRTVLVLEPPIAMSRTIALSNAPLVAISRGKRPCPAPFLP